MQLVERTERFFEYRNTNKNLNVLSEIRYLRKDNSCFKMTEQFEGKDPTNLLHYCFPSP